MTCDEYKKAVFIETTNPHLLNEHVSGCLDCVRWMEGFMDEQDAARGVATALPIPGKAAVEIEAEASERLNKVNAHLRRTIAETHKMLAWHQYAAAALQGILAGDMIVPAPPGGQPYEAAVANRACEYADAMMEAIRQRKMM